MCPYVSNSHTHQAEPRAAERAGISALLQPPSPLMQTPEQAQITDMHQLRAYYA